MSEPPNTATSQHLAPLNMVTSALGIVGGLGSLIFGLGYVTKYAYFRTLGAGWLIRELTAGEIAFGSIPPITLLISYAVMIQFMPVFVTSVDQGSKRLFRLKPLRTAMPRRFVGATAAGLIVLGVAINVAVLKTMDPSVARTPQPEGVGVMLLTFGSVMLGLAAFDAMREDDQHKKGVGAKLALVFAICALVLGPALFSVAQARTQLANPVENLSCVISSNASASQCRPVIYFAEQRVYCLGDKTIDGRYTLVVIPWSEIRVVQPPRAA